MLLKNMNRVTNTLKLIVCTNNRRKILQIAKYPHICYAKTINKGCRIRSFSTDSNTVSEIQKEVEKLPHAGTEKYDEFVDSDADIILDVDEERELLKNHPELFNVEKPVVDEFEGLNLKRGVNGVYEIEELVEILRRDKAINIFVVSVPREYRYVDYLVIASGRSPRHMLAMVEFIKKLYKRKKRKSDYYPVIEGKESEEWIAIDLGNIALHMMSPKARFEYDLETLWSVGVKYDRITNQKEDPLIQLLQDHTRLPNFTPADEEEDSQQN